MKHTNNTAGICINRLSRTGGPALWFNEIANCYLVEKLEGRAIFDFDKVIPVPKALYCFLNEEQAKALAAENKRRFGWSHWFDYCCDRWGCKGNGLVRYYDSEQILFETPYAPPTGVVLRLCELYPEMSLKLEFLVAGTDISGSFTYQNGKEAAYSTALEFQDQEKLQNDYHQTNLTMEAA